MQTAQGTFRALLRYMTVFAVGALAYGLIEIAARGYTHISMGLVGGICMLVIDILGSFRRKGFPLAAALMLTTFFITASELISGVILNLNMHLNIWDYSDMPFNYRGQICLPFVFLWFLLSILGTVVDELLHRKLFRADHRLTAAPAVGRPAK